MFALGSDKSFSWVVGATGIFVATVSTLALADGPSGHEIVARFLEVSGGTAAYAKIRNRVIEAELSLPDHGMEGEWHEIISPPNHRLVMSIDVYDEIISGVNGGVAWSDNPMDGPKILEGASAIAARRQAKLNPFLDWTSESGEAKVVGMVKIGEEDCYRVELSPKEGSPVMGYFGKTSGLLRRTDDRAAGMFRYFDDYRELDGVLVPYSTRFEVGMMMGDVTALSIKQNVELDKTAFDLPARIKALTE